MVSYFVVRYLLSRDYGSLSAGFDLIMLAGLFY